MLNFEEKMKNFGDFWWKIISHYNFSKILGKNIRGTIRKNFKFRFWGGNCPDRYVPDLPHPLYYYGVPLYYYVKNANKACKLICLNSMTGFISRQFIYSKTTIWKTPTNLRSKSRYYHKPTRWILLRAMPTKFFWQHV
jgi:hypothetical protein